MNKKILIIGLIIIVVTMSIGYAIYSTSLKVTGTGNIDSNFNIEVTGIKEDKKEGKAISITEPTYTKTSATFNTKLSREKDNIEYIVEISNKGSIDGKIENIEIINPNEQVLVETRGIEKGQILKAGETLEYIVRVCIPEGTKINEDITSKIEVFTEIIQDDKQIFNEPEGGIEANKLEIESTIEESDYTSIKATVKAKGNGLKYSYSLDDKNYTEATESNTHTFTGLTPNTRYTVYYKVEDKDGNYETESKWIETKHDNMPPECTLEVKEITLDNIKIKTTCTDETEIVKYELSESGSLYKDKGTTSEYNIDNFYLSKIKIRVTDLASNNKEYKLTDEQLDNLYKDIYDLLNQDYQKLKDEKDKYNNEFLDMIYPIGSIYTTTKKINPNETIGGVWEEYGKGKTLVGVDSNNNNFNEINKIGGSNATTLAITNMPSHNHSIPVLSGTALSAGNHNHSIPALSGASNTTGSHVHSSWTLKNQENGTAVSSNKNGISASGYAWITVGTKARLIVNMYGNANHLHTVTITENTTGSNGSHKHDITTIKGVSESVGKAKSFTNISSYITVYMWKRIG